MLERTLEMRLGCQPRDCRVTFNTPEANPLRYSGHSSRAREKLDRKIGLLPSSNALIRYIYKTVGCFLERFFCLLFLNFFLE
jgi:hypothetical protein